VNTQIIKTPVGEDEADLAAYDEAKAAFVASGAQALPVEASQMILKGESLLRALRTWRGMTQMALAEKAGIRQSFLSDLEAKKRHGSPETLQALAQALDVPLNWLT
jgi:DNA-binding XRE family transcriptional regulator